MGSPIDGELDLALAGEEASRWTRSPKRGGWRPSTCCACAPTTRAAHAVGTNTWVVDRDPAYVIDPGPALRQHVERVVAAVDARGGLGGIALTHDHSDHLESVAARCASCARRRWRRHAGRAST